MSSKKHVSRARRKNHLLKSRLDFHVPDVKVDPLKSKSIPHSLMKEERDFDKSMDDENEDRDEFVHEDWEDRIETESDGNAQTPPATRTNCLLKPGVSKKSLESSSGRTFPQDLWFLLGNYIHPESVQAFGCLCHGSWTVLKTFKFWAALYERTHKECKRNSPSEELEHRLKVSRVVRPLQVKRHVVKALYEIYPPFKERLDRQRHNSVDLDQICGYTFKFFWNNNDRNLSNLPATAKGVMTYNVLLNRRLRTPESVDKSTLFNEMSEAVVYNPDEYSAVLQITTDFIDVQNVSRTMGLQLINAQYNTSRDMRFMRLELDLSSEIFQPARADTKVSVDPVRSVQILHWWHPKFPIIDNKLPDNESSHIQSAWDE